MRKLWIVTELFYPDETSTSYILSNIANKLVDKYEVNVISGSVLYQKSKKSSNEAFLLDEKINVYKVADKNFDKNSLFQRLLKIISLTMRLSHSLWKKVKKDDKVFIVTNPAPLLILISFIKLFKGFELTILVHDVFPENIIPAGIIKSKSSLVYRLIKPVFNWAYSSSDCLIVLGRDMKEMFDAKLSSYKTKPKIVIIENWGDSKNILPMSKDTVLINTRHLNQKVTIQYAGNIGRTQGLKEFLRIFSNSQNENIYFDLWGDGAIKAELIKYVGENDLNDQVTFNGVYSRDEQNTILNSTDISLITLSNGMYGLGVPSKTYNILASGKPVLFIGDLKSEIALMVHEEKIGFCFEPTDIFGITTFLNEISVEDIPILKIMGNKSRIIAESTYSEEVIIEKYLETL